VLGFEVDVALEVQELLVIELLLDEVSAQGVLVLIEEPPHELIERGLIDIDVGQGGIIVPVPLEPEQSGCVAIFCR